MFQPASLKGQSPTPIDDKIRNKYLILYVLIILLSFIPLSLFEYYYIVYFLREGKYLLFFVLLPLNIILAVYILHFT